MRKAPISPILQGVNSSLYLGIQKIQYKWREANRWFYERFNLLILQDLKAIDCSKLQIVACDVTDENSIAAAVEKVITNIITHTAASQLHDII